MRPVPGIVKRLHNSRLAGSQSPTEVLTAERCGENNRRGIETQACLQSLSASEYSSFSSSLILSFLRPRFDRPLIPLLTTSLFLLTAYLHIFQRNPLPHLLGPNDNLHTCFFGHIAGIRIIMIQSLAIFAADLWSVQALLALAVVAILGTLVSLCPQWLRACIVHMVAYQKDPARSQAWEYHAYRLCPPLLPQFMISNLLEAVPAADSASISSSVSDSASGCVNEDNICNTKDKAVSQTAQQESRIEQQPPDDLLLSDTDTPEDHAGDPDYGREYSTERLAEWSPLNDHPLFDYKDHRMYQPEPIGHRPSTDGVRPSTTSSWVQLFSLSPAIPTAEITHLKHRGPSAPCSLSMYSDSEFSLFSGPFVN